MCGLSVSDLHNRCWYLSCGATLGTVVSELVECECPNRETRLAQIWRFKSLSTINSDYKKVALVAQTVSGIHIEQRAVVLLLSA